MTVLRAWRAAAVAWAFVIVVMGVLPTQTMVAAVGPEDVVTLAGHFAAYIVLGLLLQVAFAGWRVTGGSVVAMLLLAAALGAAIELVQGPIPYRDASVLDFLVDVAGAMLALAIVSGVSAVGRPRSRPG